ncbi:related to flavoprotein [Rhynchosporium agropyri]|uniref:Related to flavoprotein n=2 Tax=Rhynchosporium TaxID=38037 RepID=A0A1E1KXN1_9HELO|nr:related to flavoprotein [Rhynchosporium agropyri]CZT04343.1 related to flavoprotein [Rhynchosporium commune]
MNRIPLSTTLKIGLIICSTRSPRIGPDIASWIYTSISSSTTSSISLTTIDLQDFPLPISPCSMPIPAKQPLPLSPNAYGLESVNKWSKQIQKYSGFIFVTPQYNWSFPAVIKCAIDHLYHEWSGKPALIVSYGARGGEKANRALRQVLNGVRMSDWEANVQLPTRAGGAESSDRGTLDAAVLKAWEELSKKEELLARLRELVEQAKTRAAF